MRASFLYIVVLLCKIIKFICRFFRFLHRAPFAVRSDSVRRPIGFRPQSDQIASAVDQIASAVRLLVLMFYGENTKHL